MPQFRYPWRSYQQRVLDHLGQYRDDRRVHVVAPPGAGKTVLGLEIVRRIGRPALILAPSLTIRGQWAERWTADFGGAPTDVSHQLDRPAPLTIVTYQAVYHWVERAETDALAAYDLLVVDECHHLRREWWRVLQDYRAAHDPELIALTATPPYDVSGLEWRRYRAFCGKIDEEISIPELVAAGDLCPHQDYLYPILPPPEEATAIADWRRRQTELLELAGTRSELALYLYDHPWLARSDQHFTDIYEAPAYFTALLSVLAAQGMDPPAAALGVLHGETTLAPDLDVHWLTVFLARALRTDAYFETPRAKTLLRPYRRLLTEMGAWQRGELLLDGDLPPAAGTTARQLERPAAKLAALAEIVTTESDDLTDDLRLVILTDHIHAEFRPTTAHDRRPLTKVGTVPVFETLRRREDAYFRNDLCLLTGSLVVLPRRAVSRLLELAYDALPTARVICTQPYFPDSDYVTVDTGGLSNKHGVGWITRLFTEGWVKVIVGTRSLLGEGWDAPAINSLVLANTVGSFVLSNQMRGRAIRTVPGRPEKVANIWHPVVVHPGIRGGGPDVERLHRRFRAFAGPPLAGEAVIRNGLARVGLAVGELTDGDRATDDLLALRARSLAAATRRGEQAGRWRAALAGGQQLVEAIHPPAERYYRERDPLTVHYRHTADRATELEYRRFLLDVRAALIAAALTTALVQLLWVPTLAVGVLLLGGALAAGAVTYRYWQDLRATVCPLLAATDRTPALDEELRLRPYALFPIGTAAAFLLLAPASAPLFAALFFAWLAVSTYGRGRERQAADRHAVLLGDPQHRLRTYGKALAATLEESELFHDATAEQLRLETDRDDHLCYLQGAEHHDAQLFSTSLAELLAPVDNPRYLLELEAPPGWRGGSYYLPVPEALGNRRAAKRLARQLSVELQMPFVPRYTREPAGRLRLLTARLHAGRAGAAAAARREMLWR